MRVLGGKIGSLDFEAGAPSLAVTTCGAVIEDDPVGEIE